MTKVAKKDTNQTAKLWNVQFLDDYALITATSVPGLDEDDAIQTGTISLRDYYGIDVSGWLVNSVEESV